MGFTGFFIVAILFLALAAAGAAFYLYQRKGKGDTAGFFAPRPRRLAFVERTALEGGRKLLLVRRDDVEHLILVGGPVDVVIETGIREASATAAEEASIQADAPVLRAPSLAASLQAAEPAALAEPQLMVSPQVKEQVSTDFKEEGFAPVLANVPELKAAE